jgi:imidazole glycerol-phosphate synthase subunit HisH
MSTRVGIVDYGMGNRRSVQKALEHVGARATITSDHHDLRSVDGLVVPGVGAFPKAMENLRRSGLDELIRDHAERGGPLLGICLGMQVLFHRSEELGGADGLNLIPGTVKALQTTGLRVPHIGWNEVRFERSSRLVVDLPQSGCPFYHVHSFAAHPERAEDIVATCEYGERFATIVSRGSIHGVQFHPEKSSADGLTLLANFVRQCAEEAAVAGRAAAA